MIGLYANDVETRLAMAYRGLTINNAAYPVSSAVIDHRYDSVTEPKALSDGMESYGSRRISAVIRLDGVIKAESVAELHDRIEVINAAFDPVRATDADTSSTFDIGFVPFTFSVPTEDTTNYPSGLKSMQYFARSLQLPVPRVSKFEGDGARFTIVLQAVDPRRYLQAETAFALAAGSNIVNNSLSSYASWPQLLLTMSGAGSSTFTIERPDDTAGPLVLNLSGLTAGNSVVVDMQSKDISVNGVRRMDLWVSGGYFIMPAAASPYVTISSLSGISSASLEWTRAFV